ncbi:hypothetical protein T439DRAFT_59868 [Meredithblackwellia eburnea MCA 4105]
MPTYISHGPPILSIFMVGPFSLLRQSLDSRNAHPYDSPSIHLMGQLYFFDKCGDVSPAAIQKWCIDASDPNWRGTCCAVCPNNLSTVGSRTALTVTILFSTLVIVVDPAEAPFNFLTSSVQGAAYLAALLIGLFATKISRFHAYYACDLSSLSCITLLTLDFSLFCSMGFVVPLAAASVTSSTYLFGSSHPPRRVTLPAVARDYSGKQSWSARIYSIWATASGDDESSTSRSRSRNIPSERSSSDDSYRYKDSSDTAHPGRFEEKLEGESPLTPKPHSKAPKKRDRGRSRSSHTRAKVVLEPGHILRPHRFKRQPGQSSPIIQGDTQSVALLPRERLKSSKQRAHKIQWDENRPFHHKFLETIHLPPPRRVPYYERTEEELREDEEELRKVEKKFAGEARDMWKKGKLRRRAIIWGNLLLLLIWCVTMVVMGITEGSEFEFSQHDCQDPNGTHMLWRASLCLLGLGFLVWIVLIVNFYHRPPETFPPEKVPSRLDELIDLPFSFSRDKKHKRKMAVPFWLSMTVFTIWGTFLWLACKFDRRLKTPSSRYSQVVPDYLAAADDSSLLAASVSRIIQLMMPH